MKILFLFFVIAFPTVSVAQEIPDPPSETKAVPDPDPIPEEKPKDVEEKEPVDPERKRKFYTNVMGIGGGAMFITGDDIDRDPIPTINLEMRKMFVIGGIVGIEWLTNITMHDWETIGNVYKWYNKGDRDTVLLKYVLLFPGLILAPLFGSNVATGLGVVVHTAKQAPSFYFDGGGQFSLFLRPSDPDLKFDLGFGGYVGAGFDFSNRFGIGVRTLWSPPAIHSLINRSRRNVLSLSATINFAY